jgi:hypothetical protein
MLTDESAATTMTIAVFTRHSVDCPKRNDPQWRRCNCRRSLYIYEGERRPPLENAVWDKNVFLFSSQAPHERPLSQPPGSDQIDKRAHDADSRGNGKSDQRMVAID